MKHTKTPWYYDGDEGEIRCDETDRLIAYIEPQDATDPVDMDNGEHIIKCVNSHELLVEALKAFLKFDMNCPLEHLHSGDRDHQQAIIQAKQALEAAGEKI